MTIWTYGFEVSPAGTTIPSTGSFDSGANPTGSSFVSATDKPAAIVSGTFAGKVTATATNNQAVSRTKNWTGTTVHFRYYLLLPTLPSNGADVFQLATATGGRMFTMRIMTSGIDVSYGNTTPTGQSTGPLSTNTLYRVEGTVVFANGTGSWAFDVYLGGSTTPTITKSATGLDITTQVLGIARFGEVSQTTANHVLYLDEIGLSDTARLGPVSTGPGAGTATGTWAWSATTRTGKRVPKATVTGIRTWQGVAIGSRVPKGAKAAGGGWSFTGLAIGASPEPRGTVVSTWSFTGAAVGKRAPKAQAIGVWDFFGLAHTPTKIQGVQVNFGVVGSRTISVGVA